MPGTTVKSKMKDKTKASEESSKVEEEPQKPVAYEFFEPEESAKVNSKLKERVKIWRQNTVEEVPKSCQNGKNPAKGCNGLNEGVTSQYKTESVAKPVGESSKSEITKVSEESSEAEEEPQKPVANEFFEPKESAIFNFELKEKTKLSEEEHGRESAKKLPKWQKPSQVAKEEPQKSVANEFFEPKESAIFNFQLKEKTKLSEALLRQKLQPSKAAKEEPQKPVTNEFFKPKEPAILMWLQNQGLTNIDLTTASGESSKAEEEPQKPDFLEPKESAKVNSKLGAYEFVEPKESAEVDSELKAGLRAKFEINQINRGLNY